MEESIIIVRVGKKFMRKRGNNSLKAECIIKTKIFKVLQILFLVVSFAITFVNISCKKEDLVSSEIGARIGAVCNDGTTSDATGSGVCSHHGR